MKRAMLILAVATIAMFMFSGAAFAANFYSDNFPKTHYGFTTAAEGCAGCHVTHTASVAKLLKVGNTQTDFCYSCHGDLSASPYDVETGRTMGNTAVASAVYRSTAGFFGFNPASTYYGGGGTNTSRHMVEDRTTPGVDLAATGIPGNSTGLGFTGGFKCGSCHDVHAGDAANDRLLKAKIWDSQTPLATTIDFAYNPDTLIITDYAPTAAARDAINGYCGLCHGKFNVGDNGAKVLNNGKYRHAMGVQVEANTTTLPLGSKDNASNAAGKNQLLCLTCHYAHGTDQPGNASYRTWPLDAGDTWNGGNPSNFGSVLLRMEKRGVCYDCHGAATKNLEAYGQSNT